MSASRTADSSDTDQGAQSQSQSQSEPRDEGRITLRAPPPSAALLELSGLAAVQAERDEPLRETREPFRLAVRDTLPEDLLAEDTRPTEPPPASVDEALRRAAAASLSPLPQDGRGERPSGVRLAAASTIEEAVLRAIDALTPLVERRKLPKA